MAEALEVIFEGKDLSGAMAKPPELLVKMGEIPKSPKLKEREDLLQKRRMGSTDKIDEGEEGERPEKKIKKEERGVGMEVENDESQMRLKSLFSQGKQEEEEIGMEKVKKKLNEESLVNQILDINRS